MDPEYFSKEGKKDRKGKFKFSSFFEQFNIHVHVLSLAAVFAQVLAGFRYGRDDLDVLGLNFRRDLIDVSTGTCTCSNGVFAGHYLATKVFIGK